MCCDKIWLKKGWKPFELNETGGAEMKRKLFVALVLVMALGGALYWRTGRPELNRNAEALSQAIRNIHTDTVLLNEVIPFDWDAVYFPGPYLDREDIEEMIGFSSPAIRANQISEGMTHMIFVKDQAVVCCVLGRPDELGYYIWLDGGDCLSREENVWFRVIRENGVIWLDDGMQELPPMA